MGPFSQGSQNLGRRPRIGHFTKIHSKSDFVPSSQSNWTQSRSLFVLVQAKSSLEDGMQIFVNSTSPLILSYVKIRDNPHMTGSQRGKKYKHDRDNTKQNLKAFQSTSAAEL